MHNNCHFALPLQCTLLFYYFITCLPSWKKARNDELTASVFEILRTMCNTKVSKNPKAIRTSVIEQQLVTVSLSFRGSSFFFEDDRRYKGTLHCRRGQHDT